MIPDNTLPGASAPLVTRRHVLAVAGSAATAIALAACRDDSPHATLQTDPVQPNGIVVDVQSIDNTFRPDRIVVTPGTEVRWTNLGRTEHDVTPAEGMAWGVPKELFKPGDTYSLIGVRHGRRDRRRRRPAERDDLRVDGDLRSGSTVATSTTAEGER